MSCAEIELLICEYVDGTLTADRKSEVERHLSACPACAELARDSAAAVAFMDRAAQVEAPPELITRILFQAPGRRNRTEAVGFRSRLAGWFSPILQPKYAMGAAMTILSFSILSQLAPVRQLRLSDLEPVKVWAALEDRASMAWNRTVKYYDSLKFVYQIQTTLREWQEQDAEQRPAEGKQNSPKTDDHQLNLPATSAPEGGSQHPSPGDAAPANAGGSAPRGKL